MSGLFLLISVVQLLSFCCSIFFVLSFIWSASFALISTITFTIECAMRVWVCVLYCHSLLISSIKVRSTAINLIRQCVIVYPPFIQSKFSIQSEKVRTSTQWPSESNYFFILLKDNPFLERCCPPRYCTTKHLLTMFWQAGQTIGFHPPTHQLALALVSMTITGNYFYSRLKCNGQQWSLLSPTRKHIFWINNSIE